MSKPAFTYFILCASIIIIIGLILQVRDEEIFFYKNSESFTGSQLVRGWVVMLMGVVMLLLGFILKWTAKKKDKNVNGPRENPRALGEEDWIVEQEPGG